MQIQFKFIITSQGKNMETIILDGAMYAKMIKAGAENLSKNREIVNDLNVFPIPDGDTGDNMFMTIGSGADSVGDAATLSKTAAVASKGMLLGARGNSGVILSRIFAGISRGLDGVDTADLSKFGQALISGKDEAYGAVPVPVEGTILTVYREAVEYANSKVSSGSTFQSYFCDLIDETRASLDRTPELLAVLKESGVVDSGGAGLLYIFEGMKMALDGIEVSGEHHSSSEAKKADLSKFDENSVFDLGYCTEFILQLQSAKTDISSFDMDALISYLDGVGNSIVAFRDGSIVKVHVHTMHPGDVLSHVQQYGEFLTLKIENMTVQHNETTIENRYTPKKTKPHKTYGIVTVAAGDGIKDTFSALGCDAVVDGGQSMNPSAEAFLSAFSEINADTILVFPNNGNIIMTARQAAEMYDEADVRVIGTKSIGEGYAAISQLDTSSGDVDQIVEELGEVISSVVTAHVSRASRDTEKDGVTVIKDDFIGFAGDTIYVDEKTRNDALVNLSEKLGAGNYDIILVICGKDTSESESADVYNRLSQKYRLADVIMIDGGQPIYDYMMILE